jgi:Zn-dependent metalloprotease
MMQSPLESFGAEAHTHCGIIPPYLLERLADQADPRFAAATEAARQSLLRDEKLRQARVTGSLAATLARAAHVDTDAGALRRRVSDAGQVLKLPGRLVRVEGSIDSEDVSVNEAWAGLGHTHELFWQRFGWDSIDGRGLPLHATVHYGSKYDNAFWDGEQMVFGDGDGEVFTRFTASLSVIAHELTHGVTQYTANLAYRGQSGALNESLSDVFGALVEQHSLGQTATEASWLIGEGLFTSNVNGTALRSMKAPGTAYDDSVLGTDPQPGSMADYIDTDDDNGGVHLNSGIPNRAFYLVAEALGGNAWEAPGQIWFDTLTSGSLATSVTFARFARATAAAAVARFGTGSREHDAVIHGWAEVGLNMVPGNTLGTISDPLPLAS